MKNLKYESYKAANDLLNEARENNDLPRCIAAITVCESIIADRLQSFLMFKSPEIFSERGKEKKFVATSRMSAECLKHFPDFKIDMNTKKYGKLQTINLFQDTQSWLLSRNNICHGFVKTKPGTPTEEVSVFHKNAIKAAEHGFKLTKLINKWHKQQFQVTKKQK